MKPGPDFSNVVGTAILAFGVQEASGPQCVVTLWANNGVVTMSSARTPAPVLLDDEQTHAVADFLDFLGKVQHQRNLHHLREMN